MKERYFNFKKINLEEAKTVNFRQIFIKLKGNEIGRLKRKFFFFKMAKDNEYKLHDISNENNLIIKDGHGEFLEVEENSCRIFKLRYLPYCLEA